MESRPSTARPAEEPKLFIIDGHSYAYQAYYGIGNLETPTGLKVGAVFGFTQLIERLLERRPTHLVVVLDYGTVTFRSERYAQYKIQRSPMPEELGVQIPLIKEVLQAYRIPCLEVPNYEADDVIATLAKRASRARLPTFIISKDKDLEQLLDDYIRIFNPKDGELLDAAGLLEKKGIRPDQVVDYLALIGDPSDNVPGIEGIGVKTALRILNAVSRFEDVFSAEIPGLSRRLLEKLRSAREVAELSRSLVILDLECPVPGGSEPETFVLKTPDRAALASVFQRLCFLRLLEKYSRAAAPSSPLAPPGGMASSPFAPPGATSSLGGVEAIAGGNGTAWLVAGPPAGGAPVVIKEGPPGPVSSPPQSPRGGTMSSPPGPPEGVVSSPPGTVFSPPGPPEGAPEGVAGPPGQPLPSLYHLVRTREELRALSARLSASEEFSEDTETSGLDPFRHELVGLSFAVLDGGKAPPDSEDLPRVEAFSRNARVEAFYVPLRSPEPLEVPPGEVLETLRSPLEDLRVAKVGQNAKFDILFCRNAGIHLGPVRFDTMVASYLLNSEARAHSLDLLALDYLGHQKTPIQSLIGSGRNQIGMAEVPLARICAYSCEDADVTLRLAHLLAARLKEAKLDRLMREVEAPLIEVLAEMELWGIAIDAAHLLAMAERIRESLRSLTGGIHRLAGCEFNVSSPPQLAEVLYGKLGLPPGPRGKSGVPSTAAECLEGLRDRHPIVPRILEHRELTKLLGTYVEALPKLIKSRTGRIHTSFNQTVAATGRLSSSDPNLQNIPIKTELGREIRKAFRARDGDHLLLSADYSQVELRLLAHLSGDPELVAAFQRGEDIHRSVAAQIVGVPPEAVTPEMRRLAKSVNFGIVYGITPFGLSEDLRIPVEQAAEIIKSYFQRHPGVMAFMEETLAQARRDGYVRTILGRRRPIRDLASRNQRLRAIAERTAVNSVVQGSAADLIKVAMNNIYTDQKERRSQAKLLLQIHDELVLEVPRPDLAAEEARVRAEMIEAMTLRVPLVVNCVCGETWFEAKE